MIDLGFRKGPLVGEVLEGLKFARLEGEVETREEEVEWVLNHFPPGKCGDPDVHDAKTR